MQKRDGGGFFPFLPTTLPPSPSCKSEPEVGYFASTTQPRAVAVAIPASPPPRRSGRRAGGVPRAVAVAIPASPPPRRSGRRAGGVVSITDAPRLALLPAPNATSLALKSESQLAAVVVAAVAAAHPSSLVTPSRRSGLPAGGYTQLRLAPSSTPLPPADAINVAATPPLAIREFRIDACGTAVMADNPASLVCKTESGVGVLAGAFA
ncbi:hypothetical protein CVT26_011347 [Gymnopilus dilepis]|uniref:Uncharacterized protein n=1 Tax=Gymnopilus dilepis TaxID=231916 RepID=A0A409YH91_9AGAR|nr:hypothetical protein CVT26_011347 [Gymnopilus dilepis]